MDLGLKGKKVLVTGGSRGIGLSCCELFLREGASVVMVGTDAVRTEEAAARLRAMDGSFDVTASAADLSHDAERSRLFSAHSDVDILINNAGAIPGGNIREFTIESWREGWELKLFGYIHLSMLYFETMVQRKSGTIISLIGSGAPARWEHLSAGSATGALTSFTQAVGARSSDFGVRVLGVNPPTTRTQRLIDLYKAFARQKLGDENRWEELLKDLPFGRLAEPEEVAAVVVMLASERASYVSGTVMTIHGWRA